MKIILLSICCFLFFTLSVNSSTLDQRLIGDHLLLRKETWPNWTLPGPFKISEVQKNIYYPDWFYGDWIVENLDMEKPGGGPIYYRVKFVKDDKNRIVGDRAFNAESIGKALFGEKLLFVKDDPSSNDRQVAAFVGNQFLETSVIGRIQDDQNKSLFLSDELSLQIFLHSGIPRITRVETFTSYTMCPIDYESNEKSPRSTICAEQFQATFDAPGETLISKPIRTSKLKLLFHQEYFK